MMALIKRLSNSSLIVSKKYNLFLGRSRDQQHQWGRGRRGRLVVRRRIRTGGAAILCTTAVF